MLRKSIAAAFAVALLSLPAVAHDYTLGALKIHHPWARATPKGAAVGGGYLSITNTAPRPTGWSAAAPTSRKVSRCTRCRLTTAS